MNALILLCAGSGRRMEGTVSDKVLAPVRGKPVFRHALDAFLNCNWVDQVVFVHRDPDQRKAIAHLIAPNLPGKLTLRWIKGGRHRQDSVFNGLESLGLETEMVAIHDAARPLIRSPVIDAVFKAARRDGAAAAAHRVTDTIKRLRDETGDPSASARLEDLDRRFLWAMETPQVFRYEWIFDAYQRVRADGRLITDDAAALEVLEKPVTLVENPFPNPKVTHPADLSIVETLMNLPD